MGNSHKKSKKFTIAFLGLDKGGKTSIINQLRTEKQEKIYPTFNFNIEEIEFEKKKLTILELAYREINELLLKHYNQSIDGIIFVVDSSDKNRHEEACKVIQDVLAYEELKNCPILVFANKQDLEDSSNPGEITEKLKMGQIRGRTWLVQGCEALTGRGIKEGLDWMVSVLRRK